MEIKNVIEKIKTLYQGSSYLGTTFSENNTRDKVLFGEEYLNQHCTGIITSCWASANVIEAAHAKGANLIVVHEALFWNHGDEQDWLSNNQTYQMKKELLEKYKITVWRNHDYVHSGFLQENGVYVDGIFLGMIKKLGWEQYVTGGSDFPLMFEFDSLRKVDDVALELIEKFDINGVKVMGNAQQKMKTIALGVHSLGQDNQLISLFDNEKIDALLMLEMVDFTVLEYAYDSRLMGRNKSIISAGHFNTEAPGMEYMASYLQDKLSLTVPILYVSAGDMTRFIVKK